MINRSHLLSRIRSALRRSRIVSLLGPRQCGKTTLAQQFLKPDSQNYFDLEDPESNSRLNEPMTALRELTGLIVIDEIQRKPDLFPILRVLADRKPLSARFLILGSASPDMLQCSSESLSGRIEHIEMTGFHLSEVTPAATARLWLRGGFPLSFLAKNDHDSLIWRKAFVQTYLQHDLSQLGLKLPSTTLLRFWHILAHYHGQIWNSAEPARSLGISETTVRRHLDILSDLFLVRQLLPWHANLNKRQVKAPKIYFQDSGILHQMMGIQTQKDLFHHPKCGSSWEGYVIEQILQITEPDEAYFWATHAGAEIDLLLLKHGRMIGVECKRADAPAITPSMRIALEELGLDRIFVIYPGTKRYQIHDRVEVVPLAEMKSLDRQLP
ncbi:MAG: hypothetical protein A2293_07845 [Elusimicrobia bacterium RIFOXYB2_FULL_49_7]|nr:MAG: hypothetical protein A2293_07845 [Elusimicrobia bacterium RIFOXYB2_FULL_49_7]